METIVINGENFEVPVEVKDTLDGLVNAAEGFRAGVCAILGIDYLDVSDQDILNAIKSLKLKASLVDERD